MILFHVFKICLSIDYNMQYHSIVGFRAMGLYKQLTVIFGLLNFC